MRLLVCGVLAMAAALAGAQLAPNYHRKTSIEGQTLNADVICVGKIVKVQVDQIPQNHTNCVVELEQNIRGLGFGDKYQLFIVAPEYRLRAWMMIGTRLLIFESHEAIDLSDPNLEEYTSERQVLRKPEEVIAAVRRTIRERPGVTGMALYTHRLSKLGGRETLFTVPRDANLIEWAKRTIASARDPGVRIEAVRALSYCERPEDVPLFKRLLSDRSTVSADQSGKPARRYGVRMAAFEALERMGIRVSKPKEFEGG